ncbi:MAG: redoxin domain-containing protein [Bryobacteraceae bacterium]
MSKLVLVTALTILVLAARAQIKSHLKIGDMAPDFALPSTTGREIRLSEFRGEKAVILAFFPAAFTSGCTKEMKGYQAHLDKAAGAGAQVLAVSVDDLATLQKWAERLRLGFPLLSDSAHQVAAAYGVLDAVRGAARRTTFVIDKEGRIRHIEVGSDALDPVGAITACSRLCSGQ